MTATDLRAEAAPGSAVEEILRLHGAIVAAARSTFDQAIRIGELLSQQKAATEHGQWLLWVANNLPFTARTATNYVRVFEQRDRLKSESVSDLADAYRLLAPPPEPPEPPKQKADFMPKATGAAGHAGPGRGSAVLELKAPRTRSAPFRMPARGMFLARGAVSSLEEISPNDGERIEAITFVLNWCQGQLKSNSSTGRPA